MILLKVATQTTDVKPTRLTRLTLWRIVSCVVSSGSTTQHFCDLGNMDKIRRVHLEEKTGYRRWISKRYYDRPDGQDLGGKLSYTTKMAALGGLMGGMAYGMVPPQNIPTRVKLLKMARVLVPSIGMAVTFTCVTYYATNYRKKDDEFNYLLGGAAAGLILGPATGNFSAGIFGALVFAAMGCAKKVAQMNGTRLIPEIKQREFPLYLTKTWDTTLMPEAARGNWVKEPPTN